MMKVKTDQEALLDRGGRPTLRELLSHLVFSPVDGTLRLGKTRMILQRTSFLSHLREEVTRLYGRDEARLLLMRLGFQAGIEDSRFVHASWPNLDLGDAFTAGTRLHTVSGLVKVETVHNDFDFKKGKFSGEFLWHESAEALEHNTHYGPASEPICWSLVGYASGYATHSLAKLIVYKEVECEAMGHKHCRVVGKPAEVWGEDDPVVRLFREEIVGPENDLLVRTTKPKHNSEASQEMRPASFDELVIAPIRSKLELTVDMNLPLLISGPMGSGKRLAAHYAARRSAGSDKQIVDLSCRDLSASKLEQAFTSHSKQSSTALVLHELEHLNDDTQATLEDLLRSEEGSVNAPRIVATSAIAIGDNDKALRTLLGYLLKRGHITMPPLKHRHDLRTLAEATIKRLADRHRLPNKALDDNAMERLDAFPLDGNLVELESILLLSLMHEDSPDAIDASAIEAAAKQLSILPERQKGDAGVSELADRALDLEYFSIDNLNNAIYALALERAEGNVSAAAKALGLSRAKLAYRMNRTDGEKDRK